MPITKATKVAQLLNNSTGFVKNTYVDSDAINTSASLGSTSSSAGTTVYATLGDLPGSASTGAQAFVSSNSSLYIYNGSGWYKVALVNATPYWSSEASSSYTFTIDTAITITLLAGDSDGHSITYTATPDSDANLFITISKDSDNGRIFTLTPDSENEAPGTSNSGTITFKASDGISFASTVSTFTLNFANIIANSAETVLLIKAAGNSATNAAITHLIDSVNSSTDFVEQNGPEASTFSPYRSGGYSTKFADGVGGNLNWSGTYLDSDYTIEAWIYTTEVDNSGYNNIISDQSSNVQLSLHNGGNGNMMTVYQSAVKLGSTSSGTGLHEWGHFVWEREGTTIRHYANGALLGSGTADSNAFTISKIGQYYTGGYEHHGYIRDLRVLKTAKYGGSSYTIPTSTPAFSDDATTQFIACHLPYIKAEGVSISRTGTTFTSTSPFGPYDYEPWAADDGGSVKFVSTSNIATTATAVNAVGNTASSEYTIEGWVYMQSYPTTGGALFSKGTSGTTSPGDAIVVGQIRSAGAVYCSLDGNFSSSHITTADDTCPLNVWTHIALTKTSAGLHTLYVNGVSKGTYSNASVNMSASTNAYIGGIMYDPDAAARTLDGNVADVRVTNEVIYTGAFTPPTSPVSLTSNTTLLMQNKSDANIYDAAAANTLKLNSGAQSSTTTRKFTTSSSVLINGTDDKITIENLGLGGDMTFEGWFMQTTQTGASYRTLLEASTYTGSTPFGLFTYNTQVQLWGLQNGVQITGSFSQNTWHHVAVVRNSGTWTLYIDGTSQGTNTNNGTYTFADTTDWSLGAQGSNASDFIGYLQDWRISNRAVYTSNFTAPTAEFEL